MILPLHRSWVRPSATLQSWTCKCRLVRNRQACVGVVCSAIPQGKRDATTHGSGSSTLSFAGIDTSRQGLIVEVLAPVHDCRTGRVVIVPGELNAAANTFCELSAGRIGDSLLISTLARGVVPDGHTCSDHSGDAGDFDRVDIAVRQVVFYTFPVEAERDDIGARRLPASDYSCSRVQSVGIAN